MINILRLIIVALLFLVTLLPIYVENNFFYPAITGKNFGFRIIVDVIFSGWLILALYDPRYRPKISGIVLSFAALLFIMFFADLFGSHPHSSFWGNLGRMDGYITLVHCFMYMLVLGSILQDREMWDWLIDCTLAVAVFVAFYGVYQYLTEETRITSTFGNPLYLALYMIFHIFFAFWSLLKSESILGRMTYGSITVLFIFTMLGTGSRGTLVALITGLIVMAGYIAIYKRPVLDYRKLAIGGGLLFLVGLGIFFVASESDLTSDNRLKRVTNISVEDTSLARRLVAWKVAWEGVKENPVLGYGQNNFSFVVSENYDPNLVSKDWDRAHNIFIEWFVAGGFLGFIAFISIFAWCGWYLLLRPISNKEDKSFEVVERGALLGMITSYFVQGLVELDTLVSYIFLAIVFALITSRVGKIPEKISDFEINPKLVTGLALPLTGIALISSIYLLYLPGMIAAKELNIAYHENDPVKRLEAFKRALEQDSFAHQEITQLLSGYGVAKVAGNSAVPNAVKKQYYAVTEEQMVKWIADKPGDSLVHYYAGDFYVKSGQIRKANEQMKIARELSPLNLRVIIYQGVIAIHQNKTRQSHELFKLAFELNENNLDARTYYASSLLSLQAPEKALELMNSDEVKDAFANSEYLIDIARYYGNTDFERELFSHRAYGESNKINHWKKKPETWTRLAYLHQKLGEKEKALLVLRDAKARLPFFKPVFNCYSDSIVKGLDPESGCKF